MVGVRLTMLCLSASLLPAAAVRPSPAPPLRSITYSATPCFGRCAVYRVTVLANGRGAWTGVANVAAIGDRPFSITRSDFARFSTALAGARPRGARSIDGGDAACEPMRTDQAGAAIVWQSGTRRDTLQINFGCQGAEAQRTRTAIRAALPILPLAALIGNGG
jgi:hypothetical protein